MQTVPSANRSNRQNVDIFHIGVDQRTARRTAFHPFCAQDSRSRRRAGEATELGQSPPRATATENARSAVLRTARRVTGYTCMGRPGTT
jgi:hypothetical protein